MKEEIAKKIMEKQGYRFVGNHSVVKVCHYTKSAVKGGISCYKNKFYGIKSHQCAQMTPNTICSNRCSFCWRSIDINSDVTMKEGIDNPEEIVENTIKEQINLLSGFGGNEDIDLNKFVESHEIKHFAISATGEPTMYPRLGELIQKLHERGITSFLVTNGNFPDAIERLEKNNQLPTQLYVSLDAPTKEIYEKIDKPMLKDYWERFLRTMRILRRIRNRTRTVLRITAVKNLNMCNENEYAELIKIANPRFVEVKGFSLIGDSKLRLTTENVPTHEEVEEFGDKIAGILNWRIIDEQKESRVVLLAESDEEDRFLKD